MQQLRNINQRFQLNFRNKDFIFDINVDQKGQRLDIQVEDKFEGKRWKGRFLNFYIEQITKKAKNYKSFPVFIQMLIQALKRESPSVYIDFLTFDQLLLLRSRMNNSNSSTSTSTASAALNKSQINNKRYLILTFQSQFDHTHYPLQLNYDDNPDSSILQRTISRLSLELSNLKQLSMSLYSDSSSQRGRPGNTQSQFFRNTNMSSMEIVSMISQNESIKKRIQDLENQSQDEGQTDQQYREKIQIKMKIQREEEESKREYQKLTKELEDTNKTIEYKKSQLRNTQSQFFKIQRDQTMSDKANVKRQLRDLKKQLDQQKQMGSKAVKELEERKSKAETDLQTVRDNQMKLKARVKEFQSEIDTANRKMDQLTLGYRRTNRVSSYNRNYSPATSNKSRTSSNRTSPNHNRNVYNKPIALRNYTPPGGKKTNQSPSMGRSPLYRNNNNNALPGYRRNSPSSTINNNNNKYSPGAWRQRQQNSLSNSKRTPSYSPAARAAGVVPGPKRVIRPSPNREQTSTNSVFDRLYAQQKRRSSSREQNKQQPQYSYMRGRSKDPSPKRQGSGVLGTNQDIKQIINQKVRSNYINQNGRGVKDPQKRLSNHDLQKQPLNDQNRKPNSVLINNQNKNPINIGVKQASAEDIQKIDERLQKLKSMLAHVEKQ